jgi:hypothetical protein
MQTLRSVGQTLDIQTAALAGYQAELARINDRIAEVKALIDGKTGWTASKRTMSAAGRKRISDAQKARWAKAKARGHKTTSKS